VAKATAIGALRRRPACHPYRPLAGQGIRRRSAKIGISASRLPGISLQCCHHFDKGKTDSDDPIQKVSCRPDFGILSIRYRLREKFTHVGSQNNLLGKDAPEDLVKSIPARNKSHAETPPCFLWHTYEDTGVPPENSVVFYLACIKNKVPAELQVYEKGRNASASARSRRHRELADGVYCLDE